MFFRIRAGGAAKGKEVHLIIFTCVRYAREGIKDREEKRMEITGENRMEITEEKKDGGKIYYR